LAKLIVLYWRDIPAQVIVKENRASAKRELSKRFEVAIATAAMNANLGDSESYLPEWRRVESVVSEDDLHRVATETAARLELDYDDARLERLVERGGLA
jgi:hypothetical protein